MELSVPQGYHSTGNGVIARLRRSLYGLKRAPQASSEKFWAALIKLQFLRCPYLSLFLHYTLTISKKNFFIILKPTLLYSLCVCVCGWHNSHWYWCDYDQRSLRFSSSIFSHERFGPSYVFFGSWISLIWKGLVLDQHKYTMDLIEMAGLVNSTPVDIQLEVNLKLTQDNGDLLPNPTFYGQLVGNLIYLTNTRPNIAYAINLVRQFMTTPRHLTWQLFDASFSICLILLTTGCSFQLDLHSRWRLF